MPINFFSAQCRSSSNIEKFGLCDDPPPDTNPAYINEDNETLWIATVENPNNIIINFYAIDNCVVILRPNGNMESRCDGFLEFNSNLLFVELKQRESGQWVKKGREQLTITINKFKLENDMGIVNKVEAYICNSLRPIAHSGQATNIQKFKDDTGYILHCVQTINVH